MKVVDIIWDTDGEEIDLPTEMEIPDSVDSNDENAVSDYLSNEIGWLVIGYTVEK